MKALALATFSAVTLSAATTNNAVAQAGDAYMGDVILVGFSYCPAGWAPAEGQLVAISANPALYSLLGNAFGGNGVSTFAYPDMRGRIPVHINQGPGLSVITRGQMFGNDEVALGASNLPAHSHTLLGNTDGTDVVSPAGATLSVFTTPGAVAYQTPPNVAMDADQIETSGNNLPFDIHSPTLGMRYCINETGLYPPRN